LLGCQVAALVDCELRALRFDRPRNLATLKLSNPATEQPSNSKNNGGPEGPPFKKSI
jgi:hypothetical protein